MTAPPAGALEACLALLEKATDAPLRMEKFKEDDSLLTFGNTSVVDGDFRYSLWCGIKELDAHALAATWNLLRTHGPALLAALRLREWRPIESAPKDAAVLVTFAPGDIPEGQITMPGVMVAYWDAYYAPGGNGYDGIGEGWTDAHSGEGCHLHYGHPTHWMPAPPTADNLARVLEEGE